ncbi:MAG TPA: hypothetical protein PKO06_21925 [Candidatus Ozemobacteraceae bacterium]|nr:hypothetical protein [Candidatus Ozemobacteraceae bacterium]
MIKTNRCFVGLLGLVSMLISACVVTAAPAYRAERRPLAGFIKAFQDISEETLGIVRNCNTDFETAEASPDEVTARVAAGKAFYEACRERFEKLYAEADKILASPPQKIPQDRMPQTSLDTPTFDHRFNRELARCFVLTALYHSGAGGAEQAVKTLLLMNWFGHAISRGMGEVPTLIDLMIGIAIRKMTCGEVLWEALAKCGFSGERLDAWTKALNSLDASQPSYVDSLECELMGTLNATRKALQGTSNNDQMVRLMQHLPAGNREKILGPAMEYLQAVNERLLNIASVYRASPRKMREATIAFVETLESAMVMRLSDYLNPGAKIGQILASIMIPNFARAYEQYLLARYRERGTVLLMQYRARLGKGTALPKTAADFEAVTKSRIPADVFVEARTACRYVLNEKWMMVYSLGPDQKDDQGHPVNDGLLFKVPVRLLRP